MGIVPATAFREGTGEIESGSGGDLQLLDEAERETELQQTFQRNLPGNTLSFLDDPGYSMVRKHVIDPPCGNSQGQCNSPNRVRSRH